MTARKLRTVNVNFRILITRYTQFLQFLFSFGAIFCIFGNLYALSVVEGTCNDAGL